MLVRSLDLVSEPIAPRAKLSQICQHHLSSCDLGTPIFIQGGTCTFHHLNGDVLKKTKGVSSPIKKWSASITTFIGLRTKSKSVSILNVFLKF